MKAHGKKYRAAREKVGNVTVLPTKQALQAVKNLAYASFDESVDVNVILGIDPAKGEQAVRGSLVLPHSIGQAPRIIVFAKGEYAEQAHQAGADYVGDEDLIEKIAEGWLDFDYAVATPDVMGKVGKLAKILGPRGLLPNKKVGTVTFEVGSIVRDLKQGRKFFKNDKQGSANFTIGKVSMTPEQLYENLVTFMKSLMSAKPPSAKGQFLRKATVSSTMGVGIQINPQELVA